MVLWCREGQFFPFVCWICKLTVDYWKEVVKINSVGLEKRIHCKSEILLWLIFLKIFKCWLYIWFYHSQIGFARSWKQKRKGAYNFWLVDKRDLHTDETNGLPVKQRYFQTGCEENGYCSEVAWYWPCMYSVEAIVDLKIEDKYKVDKLWWWNNSLGSKYMNK